MTMPGFVFYFCCEACDTCSESYSLFVFPDLFRCDIILPAWSLTYKCWAEFHAQLSSEQRLNLEADIDALLTFAKSLSSENLTVGVPQMTNSESGTVEIRVRPAPLCPQCGQRCQSVVGYPPDLHVPFEPLSAEGFLAAPLSLVELSVRSRNICREIGITTLGQLEQSRAEFASHNCSNKTAIEEIDLLLSKKPAAD